MAESSLIWDASGGGDQSPHTEASVAAMFAALAGGSGVFRGYLNELAPTVSGSNVLVDTGWAMADGHPYYNSSSLSTAITVPAIGTTGHRIVLRANWSAQTVRVFDIASADNTAAIPAATQTSGTTYDVTLATLTITTGGTITLTDAREFAGVSPATGQMLDMGGGRLKPPSLGSSGRRTLLTWWYPTVWTSDYDGTNITRTAPLSGGVAAFSSSPTGHPFSALTGLELTLSAGVGVTSGVGTVRVVDGTTSNNPIVAPDRSPWARIRWNPTAAGNANTSTRVMGFVDASSGATNNGAYLRRNTTGNLFIVTRQGAGETATDMGAQSNAERWYDIWTPDAGVTWYCYDHTAGVLYTHTTNVPTVTTDLMLVSYFASSSGTQTDHKVGAMACSAVGE